MNENAIKRGSTSRTVFKLPDAVSLDDIQKALVLYYQNKAIVLRKDTDVVTIDTAAHTLTTELSEEETLNLTAGTALLEVCLKYISGSVLRSHIYKVPIEDTLLNQEV